MSGDMVEQPKPAQRMVDVVDCPNRKVCMTMLRYNVDEPERSHTAVRIFARKNREENFQQIVWVK